MLAAGESAEVSMKHEQEPSPSVPRERMTCALSIDEIKLERGGPDAAFPHRLILLRFC